MTVNVASTAELYVSVIDSEPVYAAVVCPNVSTPVNLLKQNSLVDAEQSVYYAMCGLPSVKTACA